MGASETAAKRQGSAAMPVVEGTGGSDPRLMTALEVARFLGMRVDWVYAQARAGRIPTVELGRYRRFRREAIEAWVRQQER